MNSEVAVYVVEFTDFELDGIHQWDRPKFCDAFISSASAILSNGSIREATDDELDKLNDDGDFVHQLVLDRLY